MQIYFLNKYKFPVFGVGHFDDVAASDSIDQVQDEVNSVCDSACDYRNSYMVSINIERRHVVIWEESYFVRKWSDQVSLHNKLIWHKEGSIGCSCEYRQLPEFKPFKQTRVFIDDLTFLEV